MSNTDARTASQIRADVEAAKIEARANLERQFGNGAWDRLAAYRKANNARALDQICAFIGGGK